jgi:hypothetical protein
LNQNDFKILIQNLNHENFRNKAFGDSFPLPVLDEFKSKSNFENRIFSKMKAIIFEWL